MRTLIVLLQKELLQFSRNSFLPKLMIVFPIMVMLVLPLVTTMDVKHVGVGIIDLDESSTSKRIVTKISASKYFTLQSVGSDYQSMLNVLNKGHIDVIISIPKEYEKDMINGELPKISIDANAVNSNKGILGMQYILQTIRTTLTEISAENGQTMPSDLLTMQYRYNETLNYKHYMIPALMIMLLIMICGFIPAINLVIEKEKGTIEQINVTPVGKLHFTLAKLIPFWVIGIFVVSIAILISWLVYGLTPAGNIGLIYLASILFIFTMSGLAITIANFSSSMQQTMFVMFFFVILFVLMSGLFTPITSMPMWAQSFTYILPPRYFIDIMRSVYLKASLLSDLYMSFGALLAAAILFNILAAITYKKQE